MDHAYAEEHGLVEAYLKDRLSASERDAFEAHYFACDAYDSESHLCTAHEERPGICRGYPWYGREPTAEIA